MSETLPNPTIYAASLAECFAHTDLEWRLAQIPDDATCRGAFFNMLSDRSRQFGPEVEREYGRIFQYNDYTPYLMYPVRDYVTRIVVLAQIQYGAEQIPMGLRRLQATAFDAWAGTMLGRAAMRVVDRRPAPILRMLERAYASHTVNSHARLVIKTLQPELIVVAFEREYLYIEHAMVGALEGVTTFCGLTSETSVELLGPFDGTIRMRLT